MEIRNRVDVTPTIRFNNSKMRCYKALEAIDVKYRFDFDRPGGRGIIAQQVELFYSHCKGKT